MLKPPCVKLNIVKQLQQKYRRPLLFAGVTFPVNTPNTKAADNKSNDDLKTEVPFRSVVEKWKKIYSVSKLIIFTLIKKCANIKLWNQIQTVNP